MDDFLINLLAGLVGAALVFVVQKIYRVVTERSSPYTGTWYDAIYDEQGNVIKNDILEIRQRGDTLYGKIYRTTPPEQRHRKWNFNGRLRGSQFFAIFWSSTADIPSYGCWYLSQTEDDKFVGYYLSLQKTIGEDPNKFVEILKPTKLSLERKRTSS